jgi:predicted short-subunit dehydrogenase-like oxidoreductase (DUF2520 family)
VDPATQSTDPVRSFALVGPGRAGTAIALALAQRGVAPVGVAGRTPDAPSTRRVASRLGVPVREVEVVGRNAELVVIATPDAAIAPTAAALAPSIAPGALVVHLAGAVSPAALDAVARLRPDADLAVLHPLQSFPDADLGLARIPGSWCAVAGAPRVERLAIAVGMRPFRVADTDRVRYHAAACVASNHLVALMGQVQRLAEAAGVPFDAFLPLVRATLDNVERLGPTDALTGPLARGDLATVAAHLDAIPASERDAYTELAREAGRLAGVEPRELEGVLS